MRTIQSHCVLSSRHCVLSSHDCSADDFSVPHSFSLHIELPQFLSNQRTKKTWGVKVRLHSFVNVAFGAPDGLLPGYDPVTRPSGSRAGPDTARNVRNPTDLSGV
jgi:hypothetical protein